ncbi:ERF family protein [Mycolicibacter heraklionensis]|uniref:ERF family protein n=1 Tax=Mycolicibacter heraklionensis TaxID=512402 RepID=UPI0007E985BA|nr:ERF family protein [Mycolicibacter heraklionensis]OBG32381.1 hypothetical protein A5671_07565 [Mycolicibacter heraklionensis]
MKIHEALAKVMADVGAVKKSDQNTQSGYNFRGIDAVTKAVYPALCEHGVIVLPKVLDYQYGTVVVGRNRTEMSHVRLTVEFTWVGPEGDSLSTVAAGEAFDSGDKATAKAHSVAFRTALLQTLCLPTDEPDPDSKTYERSAPPDPALHEANEARGEMLEVLKQYGWTPDKLISRFRSDYDADLLAADAATVKAFADALRDEAEAQEQAS